jgi:hypothetical protein
VGDLIRSTGGCAVPDSTDYQGSPRRADDVVARILADPEVRRQLASAIEQEQLGIPGVPWRQARDEARRRDEEARTRRMA